MVGVVYLLVERFFVNLVCFDVLVGLDFVVNGVCVIFCYVIDFWWCVDCVVGKCFFGFVGGDCIFFWVNGDWCVWIGFVDCGFECVFYWRYFCVRLLECVVYDGYFYVVILLVVLFFCCILCCFRVCDLVIFLGKDFVLFL